MSRIRSTHVRSHLIPFCVSLTLYAISHNYHSVIDESREREEIKTERRRDRKLGDVKRRTVKTKEVKREKGEGKAEQSNGKIKLLEERASTKQRDNNNDIDKDPVV